MQIFDRRREMAVEIPISKTRAVSSPDYGLLSKFLIEQSVQVQNKSNPSALKATDYNRALIHSHHQNSRWKLKRRLGKTPREAKFF